MESHTLPGDGRLACINAALDSFVGFPREDAQKRIHDAFTSAALVHIYGPDDFEAHRGRLSGTLSSAGILVCAPRRYGKTTAVAMWCAAMMACVPGTWISVFNSGHNEAGRLLDLTAMFFRMLDHDGGCRGGDANVITHNAGQLCTAGEGEGDVRRMHSYTDVIEELSGVGGKVLIIEEASRLREATFREVVLPLTGVRGTVLCAISTPVEKSNYYSCMLEMEDTDGQPLFEVLRLTGQE